VNEPMAWSKEAHVGDQVTTTSHFLAQPERVWQCLMFYEDVPHRPWPLLRLILPQPVRSDGDKFTVGGIVRCAYDRGYLVKCATAVNRATHLRFDVIEQQLGIEAYVQLHQGAYELRAVSGGTELALTTRYRGSLRPRSLWRLLERHLCHRVHHHILSGMRDRLALPNPALAPAISVAENSKRGLGSETR
jgi:hypothetical protein